MKGNNNNSSAAVEEDPEYVADGASKGKGGKGRGKGKDGKDKGQGAKDDKRKTVLCRDFEAGEDGCSRGDVCPYKYVRKKDKCPVCGSGNHGFKECTRFKNSTANPKSKPKPTAGNAMLDEEDEVDEESPTAAAFIACVVRQTSSLSLTTDPWKIDGEFLVVEHKSL
eukprot:3071205-Amphidinium_carterae.1